MRKRTQEFKKWTYVADTGREKKEVTFVTAVLPYARNSGTRRWTIGLLMLCGPGSGIDQHFAASPGSEHTGMVELA